MLAKWMCCKLQNDPSLLLLEGPIHGRFRAEYKTPESGNGPICNKSNGGGILKCITKNAEAAAH